MFLFAARVKREVNKVEKGSSFSRNPNSPSYITISHAKSQGAHLNPIVFSQ